MSHNLDRRPNYPKEGGKDNLQEKRNKRSRWRRFLFWILIFTPLLCMIVPRIIKDCRLHSDYVETTAHVKELYKSGKTYSVKCVSYYYCVDNEWYDGHTSPPDSIWDNLQPGDAFEIAYEKGNPSNSNWVGYYNKKLEAAEKQ